MATIEQRLTDNNEITFRVKVRLKGFPTQSATFSRITDAKKWAQQTESAIREGRHFKANESKKHTLSETIDRYIAYVLRDRPKTLEARLNQLEWWKSTIGSYLLADITPGLISECKEKLVAQPMPNGQKRSGATINRYLAALSHVLSIASREWEWIPTNPVQSVKKLKEARGRIRFLSEDERNALLEACKNSDSKYLYLIVILALSTGMRSGEILGLTWDVVDLGRRCITLHQTKNGERRVVPIAGIALQLLVAHSKVRRLDTNLLFPGKVPGQPVKIRPAWLFALGKAKIENFRFHDLRHSAASYLAMNGATPSEIAAVLGHKTMAMVKRYAHLSESHVAGVVEKMNMKIFG